MELTQPRETGFPIKSRERGHVTSIRECGSQQFFRHSGEECWILSTAVKIFLEAPPRADDTD